MHLDSRYCTRLLDMPAPCGKGQLWPCVCACVLERACSPYYIRDEPYSATAVSHPRGAPKGSIHSPESEIRTMASSRFVDAWRGAHTSAGLNPIEAAVHVDVMRPACCRGPARSRLAIGSPFGCRVHLGPLGRQRGRRRAARGLVWILAIQPASGSHSIFSAGKKICARPVVARHVAPRG